MVWGHFVFYRAGSREGLGFRDQGVLDLGCEGANQGFHDWVLTGLKEAHPVLYGCIDLTSGNTTCNTFCDYYVPGRDSNNS